MSRKLNPNDKRKGCLASHLLPYAGQLDAEASERFQLLKSGLVNIFQTNAVPFGSLAIWCKSFSKYAIAHVLVSLQFSFFRLYRFHFSVADHISLVKLLLEVYFLEDLSPSIRHIVAGPLLILLK